MDKTIKAILLTNNQILVSQIDEVPAAVPGEPDCKLTKPFVLTSEGMLESWLMAATRDEELMISSDKIMTIASPTPTLVEKYEDLTK
tara:strand:- start:478 stop:738 length:261 start_codon:yes stop_codon:yes gene_type:complete